MVTNRKSVRTAIRPLFLADAKNLKSIMTQARFSSQFWEDQILPAQEPVEDEEEEWGEDEEFEEEEW